MIDTATPTESAMIIAHDERKEENVEGYIYVAGIPKEGAIRVLKQLAQKLSYTVQLPTSTEELRRITQTENPRNISVFLPLMKCICPPADYALYEIYDGDDDGDKDTSTEPLESREDPLIARLRVQRCNMHARMRLYRSGLHNRPPA